MAENMMAGETLKLLFITRDFENRMEKSSFYLATELEKHAHVMKWEQDGEISTILNQLELKPDFILLNDYKYDYCPFVWGLADSEIPVGAIVHDLKYKTRHRRKFYEKENITHLFTHYRDASLKYFPQFTDRFHWLPHHVPTNLFHDDYGGIKDIDYLMIGAMFPKLYPERIKMYNLMKDEAGFVSHSHPGYTPLEPGDSNGVTGEAYARELNRAKIFITCDSADHFPLMKYFEVLASNTLLLASASQELSELGFVDGETFVAVDATNVKDKAAYYLANEAERLTIARRGYEMVRDRHSTEKRALELLAEINEIIMKDKNSEGFPK